MAARLVVEIGDLPRRARACPLPARVALLDMVDALGRLGPEPDDVVGRIEGWKELEVVLIDVPGTGLEAAFVFEIAAGRCVFLDLQPAGRLDAAALETPARRAAGCWSGVFSVVRQP